MDLTELNEPQCNFCAHLYEGKGWTCSAFPEGIPQEILENRFNHREPHPGDRGIQFWSSRFVSQPGEMGFTQRVMCQHRQEARKCVAFPDGIPQEIIDNEFDHRKPYPGDRGIRFLMTTTARSERDRWIESRGRKDR